MEKQTGASDKAKRRRRLKAGMVEILTKGVEAVKKATVKRESTHFLLSPEGSQASLAETESRITDPLSHKNEDPLSHKNDDPLSHKNDSLGQAAEAYMNLSQIKAGRHTPPDAGNKHHGRTHK